MPPRQVQRLVRWQSSPYTALSGGTSQFFTPSNQSSYQVRKSRLGSWGTTPSPHSIQICPRSAPVTIKCQSIPHPSSPTKMLPCLTCSPVPSSDISPLSQHQGSVKGNA